MRIVSFDNVPVWNLSILWICYSGRTRPSDKGRGRGGGGQSSRLWDKGGGVSKNFFFGSSWPHFGLIIRGDPAPWGPTPGSATVVTINTLSSKVHIQILQAYLYTSLLRLVWRSWLKIKCFHLGDHVNVVKRKLMLATLGTLMVKCIK